MRTLHRMLFILITVLAASERVLAQPGILWINVSDHKHRPVPNIQIGTKGPGSTALTKDTGLAKIILPPQTKPGTWVTLQVLSKNYELFSPFDRRVLVPPFENNSENYVTVFVVTRRNFEALESGELAVAMAARFNAKLKPGPKEKELTEAARRAALTEVTRSFGFSSDEGNRGIIEWSKRASDPYEKGVLALYVRNYPEATSQLKKFREIQRTRLAEARARMVDVACFLGQSLYEEGKYREAADSFREAIELRDNDYSTLANLAASLIMLGDYQEAEKYLNQALEIGMRSLGGRHSDLTSIIYNFGHLYYLVGKYPEAEKYLKRTLEVKGRSKRETALSLGTLGTLYTKQGRYAEAERLYKQVLAMQQEVVVSNKVPIQKQGDIAFTLLTLGSFYYMTGRYSEAEKSLNLAKDIGKKSLGANHRDFSGILNELGLVCQAQGRYPEADSLYSQALKIIEPELGPNHSDVAAIINNQALLYQVQSRYPEAEVLYRKALNIREFALGLEHDDVATIYQNLGLICYLQSKHLEAKLFYERALKIYRKNLEPGNLEIAKTLLNQGANFYKLKDYADAEESLKQSVAIYEKGPNPETPLLMITSRWLGKAYTEQEKFIEAEQCFERALLLAKKLFGQEHLNVATILEDYALLLDKTGNKNKSATFLSLAKIIRERPAQKELIPTSPSATTNKAKTPKLKQQLHRKRRIGTRH